MILTSFYESYTMDTPKFSALVVRYVVENLQQQRNDLKDLILVEYLTEGNHFATIKFSTIPYWVKGLEIMTITATLKGKPIESTDTENSHRQ